MSQTSENENTLAGIVTFLIIFAAICTWLFWDRIFAEQVRPKYFDKAFEIGKSKKSDIDAWKENGGFQIDDVWKSYEVSKVQYSHDKNGVLEHVVLVLSKTGREYKKIKGATFSNIKQDLSNKCGSSWKKDKLEDIYRSTDGKYHCKFEDSNGEYTGFEISVAPLPL